MDFKSKSMNWIVNIRQTLGTVCIEVEDKLCKEVKFVENQVQTVGVNVNKFITDVMQDFLPSSTITPAQESVCDSSVVKDAYALVEKEPSDEEPELTTLAKDSCRLLNSSEEFSSQEVVASLPPYPGDTIRGGNLIIPLGQWTASEASERAPCLLEEVMDEAAVTSSLQDTTHLDSGASCSPDKEVSSDPSVKEETTEHRDETTEKIKPLRDASHLSASENITSPSLSSELSEMDQEKLCAAPLIGEISLTNSMNTSGYASSSQPEDNISHWPDSVFDCSSPSSSYDLDPPTVADGEILPGLSSSGSILLSEATVSDDNSIESCMEDIELYDNTKLEDRCIVVDIKPPSFTPIQAGPHRSLKKMLKRALASRMGSTKREYEQLAILYGDIDADTNPSFLTKETEDLFEPDWEFV